ncbi:MAG TPA: histidine--tRNA ligase [Blastocatellia bacterium]|jgi:histidyl-tRNA synthetase|nr:histidine--tRNA ligase [Blastocatellia bacterium]
MISKVRGTQDILPARFTDKIDAQIERWHAIERAAREAFRRFGFSEIRTPIIERTEVFERGVGTETDVNKEMYTFQDRDGESISLRPESTASVVRAYIEHGLFNQPGLQKLYYIGPQFRRERPQKGRYRQFSQIGAEVLGQSDNPAIEAEVIEMLDWYLKQLGITDTDLLVNSIGDENCRPAYIIRLKEAIREVLPHLCGSCKQRYETNPLRVLDCKVESCQPYLDQLPAITDMLCEPCRAHFAEFRQMLDERKVEYRVAPRLVRGLDYYMRTAFEITGNRLGAQNTLVGGGRYDGLSQLLGGPPVKGVGFAFGVERMAMSMPESSFDYRADAPALFVTYIGEEARRFSFALATRLRGEGISVVVDLEGRKLKKALAVANNLGSRYALIIGESEIQSGSFVLRMMDSGEQRNLSEAELIEELAKGV